jgi:DNA-directed RNA polymerase subunit M/transcription elongation factor TFIIS
MENYNKLIGFTKWKMHRLTGSSKDPLDVLHSAYLREGDIYKSITNECFLLLREKWVRNQHRFGFNPPEQKQCNRCNEVLPNSEFRIIRELKYDVKRLCFICKKCENKYQLKRNKMYKERMKEYINSLDKDFLKELQEKYQTKDKRKIYSICRKLKSLN